MVNEDEREREQAATEPAGDPSTERPTLSRRRPQLRMSIVTAVIWVLLWGDLSLANLVSGFLLGLLITWVFPLPPIDFHGRFRLWPHTKLIAILLFDLVRSSFVVAAQAFHFGHTMRNAVVRVDLQDALRPLSDPHLGAGLAGAGQPGDGGPPAGERASTCT